MTLIGDMLRNERLRRGWTLKQLVGETKISPHLPEALEGNHILRLPCALWIRSFVGQYARVPGMDQEAALLSLKQQLDEFAPPIPEPKPRRNPLNIPLLSPLRFRKRLSKSSLSAFLWLLLVFACSKAYTLWRHGWEAPANGVAEASLASRHKPIGHGTVAALATKDQPQLKVILDQPSPTTANRHIVVSIPDKKLYLMEKGKIIRQYSAMLGDTNEPTPTGDFRIMEHIRWNDTVIGKAWMGFHKDPKEDAYYGIHGLGPQHDETSTSGCVALKNDDVVDLFRRVSKGVPVTILGTRILSVARPTSPYRLKRSSGQGIGREIEN